MNPSCSQGHAFLQDLPVPSVPEAVPSRLEATNATEGRREPDAATNVSA